jgi:integrase
VRCASSAIASTRLLGASARAGLRWQDVDLVAGRITVRQNVVDGRVGTPKSGKPREIPLGDEVKAALKAHRHLRGPLVFCTMSGNLLAEKPKTAAK